MRPTVLAGVALALALVAAWVPPAPPALCGDAEVAESLFKSGRQAFQKADYAGASRFFTKALEENPDLIEAGWWNAAAAEKSGDRAGALSGYREFLAKLAAKAASGTPTKEELRLRGDESIALVNGEEVAREKRPESRRSGFVGLLAQGAKIAFRKVEVEVR